MFRLYLGSSVWGLVLGVALCFKDYICTDSRFVLRKDAGRMHGEARECRLPNERSHIPSWSSLMHKASIYHGPHGFSRLHCKGSYLAPAAL